MVASQGVSAIADSAVTACAVLAAEYDWSGSELGPREKWAPAVQAAVCALLEATVPMAYFHGAGYAMVYNDRFADVLGADHPRAWGQRAEVVVPQIWARPGLAELVDEVFVGGPSFHDDGEMLGLNRARPVGPGEAYFIRNCAAVRDSDGSLLGVLVVVPEIDSGLAGAGEGEHGDPRVATWRGVELWDQTVASLPLIWSGFRACAGSSEAAAAQTCPRFVAEGGGELILAIDGPEVAGGYQVMETRFLDPLVVTLTVPHQRVSTGTAAGVDFHDCFALPDGRIVVTIGQVMGCGVAAGAVNEQVRAVLRAAAVASPDPNAIFTALDRLVSTLDLSWLAAEADGQGCAHAGHARCAEKLLVTALLAVFDPATGKLLLASAGQLPPAVVRPRTAASAQADPGRLAEFALVESGPPLGIAGRRPVLRLVLEEGDALVAFTGGLLEQHERDLMQGQERLLRTLNTMDATTPRSISEHVVDELNVGECFEHEAALLVVVRDSRAHHMASVLVPPQASAVHGARQWVRTQLESWGLGEDVGAAAVLGVSELVTNVVLYAGTPARVSMELADRLLVTVEDTGTRGALQHQTRVDRHASRGRGLALVAAFSDAMGHSRRLRGSTVWFEIARDSVSR